MTRARFGIMLLVGCVLAWPAGMSRLHAQQDESGDDAKLKPKLAPLVRRVLDDPLTTEAQRRRMLIFHGQWDQLNDPTPAEQAQIALARFDLSNALLTGESAPPLVRARAALWRGEPENTLQWLIKTEGAQADLLRARALDMLGRQRQAVNLLTPWRRKLQRDELTDPAQLVAATKALLLLADLEGRPAQEYTLAMNLLGKARSELDPLYWPAQVAEAELLDEKDNAPEAYKALAEALPMNPNAGPAWYLLGRMAVDGYDFKRAAACTDILRKLNREHLLADLLDAQSYLTQRDPLSARKVIEPALARYPQQRDLLALLAATEALSYDQPATQHVLDYLDKLSPDSALGLFTVGRFLSAARQYDASEKMLRQAIARRPNWPAPRIELGLLLMQATEEDKARTELSQAVKLDPFNLRAGNQLKMVEQLLGYKQITTQFFVIKYKDGIDEVLARDMQRDLDGIARDVTAAFEFRPPTRTSIEIMPDEQWFAVRITGMPEIWTIAACTGDAVALTPPREGPKQRGPFDWSRVIRHEYTHTVTLNQTAYRVPHWFTEACAVSMEPGGRDYETCQLLAAALQADKLFDLDTINWGFVRPRTPQDRPLAYAQAHWMLEYITVRFGHDAVIRLLGLHRAGKADAQAIAELTGQTADEFMSGFRQWATKQVAQWGLGPAPADEALHRALASAGRITGDELAALLKQFPDQPGLLRFAAERAVKGDDVEAARQAVLRYAAARPVDPWAQQALVELALKSGRDGEAIAALESLDRQSVRTGAWAEQLARVYRSAKRYDQAAAAMIRALHREPYNATYRELAAAIDLQRGQPESALRHVIDLTLIEPDRAIHQVRLAALYARLGKPAEAKAAAEAALKLDPNAPVQPFIKP